MPTLALSMIVKNVEKIIEPALASIAPSVNEVVIVDTGSIDDTKSVIRKVAPEARIFDFTPQSHPNGFLLDIEETWVESKVPPPFSSKWMLADFGAARQFGWDQCRSDYIIWLDSDDVFEGANKLPEILRDMDSNKVDTALLNYDYASDGRGNVICKLARERIARRGGPGKWMQPIHEVLAPVGRGKFYEEVNVKHLRQKYGIAPEQHHRNLKVLSKWWEKHKDIDPKNVDPRMMFYLAMEERFIWSERAVQHFKLYCQISGWDEERAVAHYLAGGMLENMGRFHEAFAEYAQGAAEAYWNPDPIFGCARTAYHRKDWDKCIEWTERGFEIAKKAHARKSVLMHDPSDRVYKPFIFFGAALVETGQMKRALDACNEGLKWNPDDPYLKGNKELAERMISGESKAAMTMNQSMSFRFRADEDLGAPSMEVPSDVLATFAIQMWKRLIEGGLYVKALQFIDSLPEVLSYLPKIRQARDLTIEKMDALPEKGGESRAKQVVMAPVTPTSTLQITSASIHTPITVKDKLDIVVWTGPAWERWSPFSVNDGGIGGSETAAWCVSRELVKRGHKVTVLSDCEGKEGNYQGVQFVNFKKGLEHPEQFPSDMFVCSRQPFAFEHAFPFKAAVIWVHDIHVGPASGKLGELLYKADKFFCLSNWHKEFFLQTYSFLHESSVIVTKNGIDLDRFKSEPKKNGNRLIYSSSPDRGLERLIQLLPEIKKEVPDVTLDVYYGFENWKKMAASYNNQQEIERVAYFERIITEASQKDLVRYHGRVNQQQLADAFLASKVWAYPTWFTETYCISAIEAQAAGCVPVSTVLAALPETVSHGFLLKPPNTSPEYGKAFVSRVVKLLRDEEERAKYAKAGREYAFLNHGWDRVAESWEKHFKEILATKNETTIPIFGPGS